MKTGDHRGCEAQNKRGPGRIISNDLGKEYTGTDLPRSAIWSP